jgi:3-oxoacyl-[acyl-carrier-protein] synthase-3
LRTNGNSVGILGMGINLPEKVLNNYDLEKMVDTSNEWITKRTGMWERRILSNDTPSYMMGVGAAKNAIENSGLTPEDIDLVIVTTEAPDYLSPSTSCLIQRHLGATRAAAFDLNAACSGIMYGMTVAKQFISSGYYKYILLVACEGLSRIVDWKDRNTAVLFGDGAGAIVLGPVEHNYGIISTHIGSDGGLGHNITIPCCYISEDDLSKRENENKRVIWMDGKEVFRFAVKVMASATEKVLIDSGLSLDDIKLIVPHQANIRIIEGAAKRLDLPMEKVFVNIHKYGNISSASIPVALKEAASSGLIVKDDYIVLVGFGGGLTWGSVLIKWS